MPSTLMTTCPAAETVTGFSRSAAAVIAGASAAATFFLVGWSPYCGPYENLWHLIFRVANNFSRTINLDPSHPDTDAEIRKWDLIPWTCFLTRFIMWKNGFKEEAMWVQSSQGETKIKVYIMRPPPPPSSAPLPLVILFHGGGMVEGCALDVGLPMCGVIGAFKHRAVIASVEYRLAPKYKYPAGIQDCIDATTALFAAAESLGCDPNNISVGGLSAGAMCAAVLHRHCAAHGLRLSFCAVLAPMLRFLPVTPSWSMFGHVGILTAQRMVWYWQCFLRPQDTAAPNGFSPLDSQPPPGPHLAPCMVATNSMDVLRDEGRAYAALLTQAGVKVHFLEARGGHVSGFYSDRSAQRQCLAIWRRAVLGPDAQASSSEPPSQSLLGSG